jgi:hypothetical protein
MNDANTKWFLTVKCDKNASTVEFVRTEGLDGLISKVSEEFKLSRDQFDLQCDFLHPIKPKSALLDLKEKNWNIFLDRVTMDSELHIVPKANLLRFQNITRHQEPESSDEIVQVKRPKTSSTHDQASQLQSLTYTTTAPAINEHNWLMTLSDYCKLGRFSTKVNHIIFRI